MEAPTMTQPRRSVVKRSIFSWVLPGNMKLQLLLIVTIGIMVAARVVPLEMQKRVINEAVNLRNVDLLLLYSGIYLVAVFIFSLFKYLTLVIQTLISERTTAAMRKELYNHILTLPLGFFRKVQAGTVVNALTSELTLPGNFVGMAVSSPLTNVLTLLAFAGYLFWLNWMLALVSFSIYPVVVFLIPVLQRRVNRSNKKRIDASRSYASRIAESIDGIHEIQGNGAHHIESTKFGVLVERLYRIRIVWSLFRFAVKSANGFFTNLGPFLIFLLGGWLTIRGQLELGALFAFLSAQEKLFDPWKELIAFYQVYQEGSVTYYRTMDLFDHEPDFELTPPDRAPMQLDGGIEVKDISFVTDSGIRLIDRVSLSLDQGEHLALVGFSGSGKSTLALCIGQLYKYAGGSATIGGQEIAELTKADIRNAIGYVAQEPFIFDGTLEENILYACQAKSDGDGNQMPSTDDVIAVLHQTGIFVDVLRFGLNTVLNVDENKPLVEVLLRVRQNFKEDFGEALADYVEFFDLNQYLHYSSVADNLIFGVPNRQDLVGDNLYRNDYFNRFLDTADLTRPLLSLGSDLIIQSVDILKNLPPDAHFFEQSPIVLEELETYEQMQHALKKKRLHELSRQDHQLLLSVALRFKPGIHKMVSLPKMLENLILEGRALFRQMISNDDPMGVHFYQESDYISSQTLLNNIVFGRIKARSPKAQERIDQSIIQLLIEEDLLERVMEIGMRYDVGSKGDNLSGGQRQKLAIARVFLKDPKILILDEATSALDNKSQARIQNIMTTRLKHRTTIISIVHRLDTIKDYDKVAVLKAGKLIEMGSYEELMARKGTLYELVGKR
jgi:ABC-type multidrug transport system fused ATPase/permease subunit